MRKSFFKKVSLMACGLLLALGSHTTARAETDVSAKLNDQINNATSYIEQVCEKDAAKYCSSVTPGEGRLIMCALAHEDKLSKACTGAIFDALLNLGGVVSNAQIAALACDADIEKLCGNIELGEGKIVQCIVDNKTNLSKGCASEVRLFESSN